MWKCVTAGSRSRCPGPSRRCPAEQRPADVPANPFRPVCPRRTPASADETHSPLPQRRNPCPPKRRWRGGSWGPEPDPARERKPDQSPFSRLDVGTKKGELRTNPSLRFGPRGSVEVKNIDLVVPAPAQKRSVLNGRLKKEFKKQSNRMNGDTNKSKQSNTDFFVPPNLKGSNSF